MSCEQQIRDILERMEVDGAQQFSSGDLVELSNLLRRIAELEAAIRTAPHQMGCHSIQDEFCHTLLWATLEYCDCWKRDVLTPGDE